MWNLLARFVLWVYRKARIASTPELEAAVERAVLAKQKEQPDEKVRYLLNEVSELRALVRFLLPDSPNYQRYVAQTRASFDYQWKNLQEGAHLLTDEKFQAEAVSLLERNTALPRSWFPGKKVLDAGCGNGRWSHTLCQAGAQVTAIDQSDGGVLGAQKACGSFPGFTAKQADLLKPLGMSEQFDLVWCFGVIHHTGNTWLALQNVADAVKKGGYLYLMVYGEPRWEVPSDFAGLNEYTALRRTLRTLSFDERVDYLKAHKAREHVHGWFDAVSPEINDLHRYDELTGWLAALGFKDWKQTFQDRNLNVMARRA